MLKGKVLRILLRVTQKYYFILKLKKKNQYCCWKIKFWDKALHPNESSVPYNLFGSDGIP